MDRKVYIFLKVVLVLFLSGCVSNNDNFGSLDNINKNDYREDIPIFSGISSSYQWVQGDNPPKTRNLSYILGGYNYGQDKNSKFGGFLKVGASLAETRNKDDADYPEADYLSWTAGLEIRRTLTSRKNNIYLDGLLDIGFFSYEPSVDYQKSEDYVDRLSTISIGTGLSTCIWNKKSFAVFIDPIVGVNMYGDPLFYSFTNEKPGYEFFAQAMIKLVHIQNP